jgi:DNA-binding winged helix-turn-helix (wHTH) protein
MSGLGEECTTRASYQFGPFFLDMSRGCLLLDAKVVPLRPKLFELLLAFVRSEGRLLSKEELMEAVWQDTHVEGETVARSVRLLNRALTDGDNENRYIETVKGRGYRFTVNARPIPIRAREGQEQNLLAAAPDGKPSSSAAEDTGIPLAGRFWHVLVASTLYGILYAVALLLEIAYSWDEYGTAALKRSVVVFAYVSIVAAGGLWLDWTLTSRGLRSGLVISGLVFLLSAAALYGALCYFLPSVQITKATFQTYTAQGAYFKDSLYFLILAGVFLIAPFHFVGYLNRELLMGRHGLVMRTLTTSRLTIAPKATTYLAGLLLLLFLFAVRSTFDHSHLLDNLLPGPHKNLFIQLIYARLTLYFALAVECLIWYYRALNSVKHECIKRESAYAEESMLPVTMA